MTDTLVIIDGLVLGVLTFIAFSFFLSSIREKEKRASIVAGIQFLILLALMVVFFHVDSKGYFDTGAGLWVLAIGLASAIFITAVLFLPIGADSKAREGTKGLIIGDVRRVDERDTVFSVMAKQMMESSRDGGGQSTVTSVLTYGIIDGPGGSANVAMTHASAMATRNLAMPDQLSPEISENRIDISSEEASQRVKGFTKHLGAVLMGITEINPLWIYSHRGRSGMAHNEWGREISLTHKYAVVFAEEMDIDLIAAGPHTPAMLETMKNYATGAFIAAQVASFITNLGYSAKANQMAHYDALMVPLAVDAGLGELSRMGYLITKDYGPRVRLSAVTTDLPLIPDKPVDIGVTDFCAKCKKCAHCCPSRSISHEEPAEVNGSLRWKLDENSCFEYWQKVGTDCSICMRVCPWSHARTFPHRIIVEAVSRNAISRTLFNRMDDIFYGKKPRAKDPPGWARYDSQH